ncbi:hypothetical protein KKF61_06270 [Patescibacteria group bacterium]|nr:hypothetical protein [Patescibacteria group bacterium]MBU0963897.1 hypothetical protein [Patescibacteria group bacterium]
MDFFLEKIAANPGSAIALPVVSLIAIIGLGYMKFGSKEPEQTKPDFSDIEWARKIAVDRGWNDPGAIDRAREYARKRGWNTPEKYAAAKKLAAERRW